MKCHSYLLIAKCCMYVGCAKEIEVSILKHSATTEDVGIMVNKV